MSPEKLRCFSCHSSLAFVTTVFCCASSPVCPKSFCSKKCLNRHTKSNRPTVGGIMYEDTTAYQSSSEDDTSNDDDDNAEWFSVDETGELVRSKNAY